MLLRHNSEGALASPGESMGIQRVSNLSSTTSLVR